MKDFKKVLKSIILGAIVVVGASYVYAWSGPGGNPPLGNTSAPVNVGNVGQIKDGGLTLGAASGVTFGLIVINGQIQFQNLSGAGTRMVVADANGILSTQPIPSSSAPAATIGCTGGGVATGGATGCGCNQTPVCPAGTTWQPGGQGAICSTSYCGQSGCSGVYEYCVGMNFQHNDCVARNNYYPAGQCI